MGSDVPVYQRHHNISFVVNAAGHQLAADALGGYAAVVSGKAELQPFRCGDDPFAAVNEAVQAVIIFKDPVSAAIGRQQA